MARIDRRAMKITGLKVGAAVISMRVSVEPEGVQIDLAHLSGGAAKLSVLVPEDPQYAFADEYVDWYRQEKKGAAHAIELKPGDDVRTLYARFEPRPLAWPTALPERIPSGIETGTLWLVAAPGDPDRALLEAVAASLEHGPLRLRARLCDPVAADRHGGGIGIAVDLTPSEGRDRKLAWLASSVERTALDALRR